MEHLHVHAGGQAIVGSVEQGAAEQRKKMKAKCRSVGFGLRWYLATPKYPL